jgi:hypothetical protein
VPRGQQPFRLRTFQPTVGGGKFVVPSSTKMDLTFRTGTHACSVEVELEL